MAQDQQKKLPGLTDRFTDVFKGGAQGQIRDQAAQKAPAADAGNAAQTQRVAESDLRRDQMLQFVAQRLAQAKVLQARELDQIMKSRVWYDEVAKGKQGFKLPDPTRWRNCARMYERTIEALCNGELGRGAQLLDQAIEAEKAVYHSLPNQVHRDDFQQAPNGAPDARLGVDYDMSSTPIAGQEMLALAREIANVTTTAEDAAYPQRQRPHKGWWDKGADGEDAKKEAPKAAAAAVAVEEIAKSAAPQAKAKEAGERDKQEKKAPGKAAPEKVGPEKDEPEKAAPEKASPAKPGGPKAGAAPDAKAPKDPKAQAAEARAKAEQQEQKQEEDQQGLKAQKEIVEKVTATLPSAKGGPKTAKPAPKKK